MVRVELRKYTRLYKRAIGRIQNLLLLYDQSDTQNLGTLNKAIEREITSFNNKLTRSAESMLTKATKQSIIDTKASLSMIDGKIRYGGKV